MAGAAVLGVLIPGVREFFVLAWPDPGTWLTIVVAGSAAVLIAASDGNVDHGVVDNPQDIFVGRAIGHGVVNSGGEKHEEKADDKDRSTDSRD